jgi:hypothetical protein
MIIHAQVGSPDIKIVVVRRPASSGSVVTNVAQAAGAIGYTASGVTLVAIGGNAPTATRVAGQYLQMWSICLPGFRP